MAHAFHLSTPEAEAGGALNVRPSWSTYDFLGQPGLHSKLLSLNKDVNKDDIPRPDSLTQEGRKNLVTSWTG